MKIVTFNVNGLRARIKAGWPSAEFLEKYDPDVICLQEVRAKEEQIPPSFLANYNRHHSIHDRAGYAGAWTFVKKTFEQPMFSMNVIPVAGFDERGRVSILDFKYFKIINSYTPNAGSRLEKISNRVAYEDCLHRYIKEANGFKPVILCGDLNVAPQREDCNISVQAGCTPAERNCFAKYKELDMVDVWRHLHPDEPTQFTFFSNMYDARKTNKGMRLDHFCADPAKIRLEKCEILHDYAASSDHTPVLLEAYFYGT